MIDWSDLGHSVVLTGREAKARGLRCKRPLARKSLKRVCNGVLRFVIDHADPFTLRVTTGEGRGWKVSGIGEVLPTQTTRHDLGLVSPIVAPCGGPRREPGPVGEALNTILAREDRGLAVPVMAEMAYGDGKGATARRGKGSLAVEFYGNSKSGKPASEVLGCIPTVDRHALTVPVVAREEGNGTDTTDATDGGRCGLTAEMVRTGRRVTAMMKRCLKRADFARLRLSAEGLIICVVRGIEYVLVDILFRMLKVRELADAMGFPAWYVFPAVSREAVKLIGNAVSPLHARAIIDAVLPRGGPWPREREECAA